MDIDDIEIFVKVIQTGSFSGAAKEVGLPNTTVSSKVAKLEKRLGVTLIQRTTRKLSLTSAGKVYFDHCLRGLDEIKAGEAQLVSSAKEATGTLRITAASDVAHALLPPVIKRYLAQNPKVNVELIVTSKFVDLVAEGVDLAIRPGKLKDSTLIARVLPHIFLAGLWATPEYLSKRKPPKTPQELESHSYIGLVGNQTLVLQNKQKKIRLTTNSRIVANDLETLKAMALLGEGITFIPEFLINDSDREKLVRVLPNWYLEEAKFSVVYPAQKFVSPKVRNFIDMLFISG